MTAPLLASIPLLDYCAAAAATYAGTPAKWTSPRADVHSFLSELGPFQCIAQEGTQSGLEWFDDFDAVPVRLSGVPEAGLVHQGLRDTSLEVFPQIKSFLEAAGWPLFVLVGHSKGAGEVCILAALFKSFGHPPAAVAALEPPMVGGPDLKTYLADIPFIVTQTVNAEGVDIVTEACVIFDSACHVVEPTQLRVPDDLDIEAKHLMPAVTAAVSAMG